MPKVNRKAVEANLRNKLAAQYREKIETLKKEEATLAEKYKEMWERARQAETERDELKDKVAMYEDWNRRLQEFMDMNEDDRKQYLTNLRNSNELDKLLEKFTFFGNLTDLFSL